MIHERSRSATHSTARCDGSLRNSATAARQSPCPAYRTSRRVLSHVSEGVRDELVYTCHMIPLGAAPQREPATRAAAYAHSARTPHISQRGVEVLQTSWPWRRST